MPFARLPLPEGARAKAAAITKQKPPGPSTAGAFLLLREQGSEIMLNEDRHVIIISILGENKNLIVIIGRGLILYVWFPQTGRQAQLARTQGKQEAALKRCHR